MTTNQHCFKSNIKTLASLFFAVYLITSANTVSAKAGQEKAMQQPVDQLHNALISIMKSADSSSFDQRYASLEDVIDTNFNTPLISRVILSRYWKSLDETAQTNFIDLFKRLTISTYVDRFDSYENESFEHISIEPMKKDRFLVKTNLIEANGDSVSFNYIVQKNENNWKIISVIANGINDLSLKRSEYTAVIKDKGFDALIENIKNKISVLQSSSSQ